MRKSAFSRAQKQFQAELRKARLAAGLRQEDVAAILGKPQSFVAKYESGERRIDVAEFIAIARALRAEPARLMRKIARTVGL